MGSQGVEHDWALNWTELSRPELSKAQPGWGRWWPSQTDLKQKPLVLWEGQTFASDQDGNDIQKLLALYIVFQITNDFKFFSLRDVEGYFKNSWTSLPGGSVVKNSPANAGDMDLIPVQEDHSRHGVTKLVSHQLLSLGSRAGQSQLLKLVCPRACAPQEEKPSQYKAHTLQLESSPCSQRLEKSWCSNEDPAQPKINK